jgi:hypothetical protein
LEEGRRPPRGDAVGELRVERGAERAELGGGRRQARRRRGGKERRRRARAEREQLREERRGREHLEEVQRALAGERGAKGRRRAAGRVLGAHVLGRGRGGAAGERRRRAGSAMQRSSSCRFRWSRLARASGGGDGGGGAAAAVEPTSPAAPRTSFFLFSAWIKGKELKNERQFINVIGDLPPRQNSYLDFGDCRR